MNKAIIFIFSALITTQIAFSSDYNDPEDDPVDRYDDRYIFEIGPTIKTLLKAINKQDVEAIENLVGKPEEGKINPNIEFRTDYDNSSPGHQTLINYAFNLSNDRSPVRKESIKKTP